MTHGIEEIKSEMDVQGKLTTEHGYAAQEIVNLMLTGDAHTNVHDGSKTLSEELILKGIHQQSEIGFLTLYEAYGYFEVGKNLKKPKLPIWIVCSESHYSVLFSLDIETTTSLSQKLDLIYYDELAKQEFGIVLSIEKYKYKGPKDLKKLPPGVLIPPIESVIRTKWDSAEVDWNGATKIL